jgi:hypothetical protein
MLNDDAFFVATGECGVGRAEVHRNGDGFKQFRICR